MIIALPCFSFLYGWQKKVKNISFREKYAVGGLEPDKKRSYRIVFDFQRKFSFSTHDSNHVYRLVYKIYLQISI